MKRNRTHLRLLALAILSAIVFLMSSMTAGAISIGTMPQSTDYTNEVNRRARIGEEQGAKTVHTGIERSVNTYALKTVANKSVYSYKAVSVSLNGRSLALSGRVINGEVYIPMRSFVESFVTGAVYRYNSASRTVTVTGAGHNISVSDGAYALYASGRVFFAATPSRILSDGRMYVPVSNLSRAFSLSYAVSATGSLSLSGTPRAVVSGSAFYDADVVYWLSRIISAESRGEPLTGQIAVGNVVLNRVRSSAFPNTVWGVIFDRKWGVQFSPVSNGTIYNEPAATSVLAAKICLDGFTVSPDALYFLRPSASSSSWVVNTRPFLFVIGNHYFFA